MSRRRSQLSFSLFAFQDIITAVTGILLLITITLAIILITTETVVPIDDRLEYHKQLQDELAVLAKKQDTVQIDLAAISKKNKGISRLRGEELKRE